MGKDKFNACHKQNKKQNELNNELKNKQEFNNITKSMKPENQNQSHNVKEEGYDPHLR